MSRSKQFSNLSLLEQIEVVIKKQLPKESTLTQLGLTVTYALTMNVTTEDNPFELSSKNYRVIANYKDNTIEVVIKDGDKTIKETVISLQPE